MQPLLCLTLSCSELLANLRGRSARSVRSTRSIWTWFSPVLTTPCSCTRQTRNVWQ